MKPPTLLLAHITATPHLHTLDVGLVILEIASFVMFLVIMAIIQIGKKGKD